jgi:hypothetical protein
MATGKPSSCALVLLWAVPAASVFTQHKEGRSKLMLEKIDRLGPRTWDYPIGETEVPATPLIAARQAIQKAKNAYYARQMEGAN